MVYLNLHFFLGEPPMYIPFLLLNFLSSYLIRIKQTKNIL